MASNKLETNTTSITMNLNNIVYQNILKSPYYQYLQEIQNYPDLLNEIYKKVTFLEPFFKGTSASSAFCILYKFWLIKLTQKQVNGLLNNSNAYVRAIGLLYLRYVVKYSELYDWFEDHLDDDQEVKVEAHVHAKPITMGTLALNLLRDFKFYGTVLPRIPISLAKEIDDKLKERFSDLVKSTTLDSEKGLSTSRYSISSKPGRSRSRSLPRSKSPQSNLSRSPNYASSRYRQRRTRSRSSSRSRYSRDRKHQRHDKSKSSHHDHRHRHHRRRESRSLSRSLSGSPERHSYARIPRQSHEPSPNSLTLDVPHLSNIDDKRNVREESSRPLHDYSDLVN